MLPLEGVRVVEAAQMISAPFATAILADQGAEVIKVEAADGVGDRLRFLGDKRNGMATVFHGYNRGKRSVCLNTKQDAGREALVKLIDSADVFVQNFRPGVAERMGVGPDAMREHNPGLIYVSISGFGPTGPYADQMVYDFVVQGMVGIAAREGSKERPRLASNYVVDKATALTAAQAISAALYHRAMTGEGQHLEIDMLGAGFQFFWVDGMSDHTLLGDDFTSQTHMSESYDVRPTKDGFVSLNLASRSTWPRLVKVLDSELIDDDPRFADFDIRQDNAAALVAIVDEILGALTTEEVIERMRANDLPGGKVLQFGEIHQDPQVVHNQVLVELDDGPIGARREPRPAARFGATETPLPQPAPLLGADTAEVLASLGYSEADIERMAAAAVEA